MGEVALVMGDIDNGLRERLDAEINAFNVAAASCADGGVLRVAVRGDGGQLCGGMFGWTWGGRGFIEFLWVRGDHRGSGLGLGCWLRAEQEAQRRGCDQVALSTHSFQAPGLYARLVYYECGRMPAYPAATTTSTSSSSCGE